MRLRMTSSSKSKSESPSLEAGDAAAARARRASGVAGGPGCAGSAAAGAEELTGAPGRQRSTTFRSAWTAALPKLSSWRPRTWSKEARSLASPVCWRPITTALPAEIAFRASRRTPGTFRPTVRLRKKRWCAAQ